MRILNCLFITWLFILVACQVRQNKTSSETVDTTKVKPNVILLLADDLGYGDLSSYGSQSIKTPHLDELASDGIKLTRFYAASAVCSPSRASILTGKFPLRFNIRKHFSDSTGHLPSGTPTLAKILRNAGYATAHIGKWHLGGLRLSDINRRQKGFNALPGPLEHGFDHYLTNIEGSPIRPRLVSERQLYRQGGHYMLRNDKRVPENDTHWTEIKINEASRLISDWHNANQPFFLNIWFDVPHTPYEPAPEPHLSTYKNLGVKGDQLYFRSMVSHLDAQIGRLVDSLKARNLYENSLIIFTSDNGPAYEGSPGPFKGGKTDLHEGGIRVPMFAVWKGQIPGNTYSFQTMHMVDLLPTIAEAVGLKPEIEKMDGISLLEQLKGGPRKKRGTLFWQMDLYKHFQNQGPKPKPFATTVVKKGKWKLLSDSLQPTELFNLEQDHRELFDQLDKRPEITEELHKALGEFLAAPRNEWTELNY